MCVVRIDINLHSNVCILILQSFFQMTTQNNPVAGFPPPLNYPRPGFGIQRGTVRAGGTQYVPTNVTNPQLILQRKQQQLQQEQHKRRLLQQQQQQQLLIPSNAAAADINSGLQVRNLLRMIVTLVL